MAKNRTERNQRRVIQIDVLPDDVLLEIFDFYLVLYLLYINKREAEAWQLLVHVCRRWRSLVFRSPRRLNLQLHCTPGTPARDTLDVWPALPLIIKGNITSSGTDNVIAALEQSNRVCRVDLALILGRQLEKVLSATQVPFPELTNMRLWSYDETPPVLPDSFLGGSAPRLQSLELDGVSFPGFPNLLMSTNHLVSLKLISVPHSGYISPEAMVALLSVLSSLGTLFLEFQSPQSCPDWRRRRIPPLNRTILPALDEFRFKGVTEYLEEFMTRIVTPQLDYMEITFFNQIDFDTPRLAQFISRTPTLGALDEAHVRFYDDLANVALGYRTSKFDLDNLEISISCREPDWQLSSIEQVCNTSFPSLSPVEDLYIEHRYWEPFGKNDLIENALWLELLHLFTAVKNLYLSKEFAPSIAAALQELFGARIMEVLPSLQNIFVEELKLSGAFEEKIGQFVAVRQLSDYPIAISVWDKDPKIKPT